jgi:hypothetical protein
MTAFCTHLEAIYYPSQQIECNLKTGNSLSGCSQCAGFSARQFWQAQPRTLLEFKTAENETESPVESSATNKKKSWRPEQSNRNTSRTFRETGHGYTITGGSKTGCGSCGGSRTYTKVKRLD